MSSWIKFEPRNAGRPRVAAPIRSPATDRRDAARITMMDLLAAILACSLHPDEALVRALIETQSRGNVYFVGDLATLKTNDSLKSAEAALLFAEDLRQHGGRPAVGLLGIPLEWAARYGRSPVDLFDGCTNVGIATAALAEYRDQCSSVRHDHHRGVAASRRRRTAHGSETTATRTCVLARFADDLGLASEPAAILRSLTAKGGRAPVPDDDGASRSSAVFVDGGDARPPSAGSAANHPTVLLDGTLTVPSPR